MWLQRLRQRAHYLHYLRDGHPEAELQRLIESTTASRRTAWQQARWLALDIETTGLNPEQDEIVSIGWVAIDAGRIQLASLKQVLVRSRESVGGSATIHYLTDNELDQGATLRKALLALADALAGRIAVVHHRRLDEAFLRRAFMQHFGLPLRHPMVDTLQLEKRKLTRKMAVLPRGSLRLSECRKRYTLPGHDLHNAAQDALACAELFIAWAAHQSNKGPSVGECMRAGR